MGFFDFLKKKTKVNDELKEEFKNMREGLDYLDKMNIDDYKLYQHLKDKRIKCYNLGNSIELELNIRVSDVNCITYRYILGVKPYRRQLVLTASKVIYELEGSFYNKLIDRYSVSTLLTDLDNYGFKFNYTPCNSSGLFYFEFCDNILSVIMEEKSYQILSAEFNFEEVENESESELAYTSTDNYSSV